MDLPDPIALASIGEALETGLVYLITLAAAFYLGRTLYRIFRPRRRQRRTLPAATGTVSSESNVEGCGSCRGCG